MKSINAITGREAAISAITDSLHGLTDDQLLEAMEAIRSIGSAATKSEQRNKLIQRINKAVHNIDYLDLETLAGFAETMQRK